MQAHNAPLPGGYPAEIAGFFRLNTSKLFDAGKRAFACSSFIRQVPLIVVFCCSTLSSILTDAIFHAASVNCMSIVTDLDIIRIGYLKSLLTLQ